MNNTEEAPTDEEMIELVRDAVADLKEIATRLESHVGERSPTERTRTDDNPHWSDA